MLAAAAALCLSVPAGAAAKPVNELRGADFAGGARAHFGSVFYARQDVNYVYAQSNGAASRMAATLKLGRVPPGPLFLFLEAMDDDTPSQCRVRLALNGRVLLQGPSGFPDAQWLTRRIPIPKGLLREGPNELSIACDEPVGPLGSPPWFMVARCALGGRSYALAAQKSTSLQVRLPQKACPFPEPLRAGHPQPGFGFRGTKGWNWTPEQYLAEVPILARLKMNFLMNCYLSMFTSGPGGAWQNEWWKPMTEARREAYARVFRACREQGITYCFAVHPQLGSPRPLVPGNAQDLEQFYQHYAWAQEQGVHWFSVSLDDVSWGAGGPAAGGSAHAGLVNAIFGRLREKDPEAQIIFCPVPYWGDGTDPEHRAYLEALAREMHPDVYVFWTGDGVVIPRITRKAAESYKRIVKHRLFLWDNYPVNDSAATLHLGPVSGRDPDLCKVIDGYMSNPMCPQSEMNRIPLATCADYAYNPWVYDPGRSIGQSILLFARTAPQRRVLKDLVEAYPGFLVAGGGTGTNPVRSKLAGLAGQPEAGRAARNFVRHMESVSRRLAKEFPRRFAASKRTLAADVAWMKERLTVATRPIVRSDFARVTPADAVATSPTPGKWLLQPLKEGHVLFADGSGQLPALTYPLSLRGWHDISIGLCENPVDIDDAEWQGIHVKLTSDPWYTHVCGGRTGLGRGWENARVDGTHWKRADLTGESLVIYQPFGRFFRPAGGIAYVKLVPLTEQQVKAERAQAEKRLAAARPKSVGGMADFWSYVFVTQGLEPKDTRKVVDNYLNAGFDTLYFMVNADGVVQYHSKVAQWVYYEPSEEPRAQGKACADILKNHDPLRVAGEYAREKGLRFFAWFRVTNEQHPDSPFNEYSKRFRGQRVRGADNQPTRWPSLGHQEVRDCKLAILTEIAADYPVDGLMLDFLRTMPVIGYDAPVVEAYVKRYGVSPLENVAERSSPRWKRFRAGYVTAFVRELKAAVSAVEKRTGRRIEIAARVTPRENLWKGLDVATWIREGLIDIVVPCNYSMFDPPVPVKPFLQMAKGTKCKVTPGINPFFAGGDDDAEHHPNRDQQDAAEVIIKRMQAGPTNLDYSQAALRCYEEGADGVVLYEAETLTARPPLFPGRDGLIPMFRTFARPAELRTYVRGLRAYPKDPTPRR